MNPAFIIAGLVLLFPLLRMWEATGETDEEDGEGPGPPSTAVRIVVIVGYITFEAAMLALSSIPVGI